jgi:diguanylate cyclase (GGDEF)-like protein
MALSVPAIATLMFPGQLKDYEVLVWLVALIPAFMVSYYRGWGGVARALAIGMVVLTGVQIVLQLQGRAVGHPHILLTVVGAYVFIGLGVGLLTELIHRERERAVEMAFTDGLTGLPNRRLGELALDREFAAATRGRELTVVMWDLDDFKRFNDTYGHAAGDEVLQEFGAILGGMTRKMNLSTRWGGEEFLSVVSSSTTDGALVFVGRVQAALSELSVRDESVTVSVGLASYTAGCQSVTDLIAAADEALYDAKASGRGQARVWNGGQPAVESTLTSAPAMEPAGRVA